MNLCLVNIILFDILGILQTTLLFQQHEKRGTTPTNSNDSQDKEKSIKQIGGLPMEKMSIHATC